MNKEKIKLRLSDKQMERVCEAARKDWSMGVVDVFRCLGVDLASEDCPQINPSDYAIPEDQWGIIAQACMEGIPASDIGKVNHMLDFMNYGPSGYGKDEWIEQVPTMETDEEGFRYCEDPCDEWKCIVCGTPIGLNLHSHEDNYGIEREVAGWTAFWIQDKAPGDRYCEDCQGQPE